MPCEEITYNPDQFCKAFFGEGIQYARRYVEAHPKNVYSVDDFIAVYRMKEDEEGCGYDICSDELDDGSDEPNNVEYFVSVMERANA